jgi:hypothetical protein
MRMTVHILVALTFSAIAFVVGLFLPLSIYWFTQGDAGEPGGYALGLVGLSIGITGAVTAGFFSLLTLPEPDEEDTPLERQKDSMARRNR